MLENFSFSKRNFGHWDIYSSKERIFKIRGGGYESWDEIDVIVLGENSCKDATPNGGALKFKTITAATSWVMDFLMHEPKVWPKEGVEDD